MDRGKRPVNYDEEEEDDPIQIQGSGEMTGNIMAWCLLVKLWTDRPYSM